MTAPVRPHCQAPDACDAKGKKHCHRCAALNPIKKAKNIENGHALARKAITDHSIIARRSAALRKRWADPSYLSHMAEVLRQRHAKRRGFSIPEWVGHAGLKTEYVKVAKAEGEEAAASHCRALKRRMSSPFPSEGAAA